MTHSRSIRWHLLQVQLVSIVPIGLFAAMLLYLHWHVQDQERQRSQIESVRLLAAAVDNALDSTAERLTILARLWSSTSLSERAIYRQARQAVAGNTDWRRIIAFDAGGRSVFRTDAPFGADAPSSLRFDVWRPAFTKRQTVVSDVYPGVQPGSHWVAVGVPVTHGDRVAYVLIASLDPAWYDRLLNKQGQPAGAVAGVFDRHFKFVARSSEGDGAPRRRSHRRARGRHEAPERGPGALHESQRHGRIHGLDIHPARLGGGLRHAVGTRRQRPVEPSAVVRAAVGDGRGGRCGVRRRQGATHWGLRCALSKNKPSTSPGAAASPGCRTPT